MCVVIVVVVFSFCMICDLFIYFSNHCMFVGVCVYMYLLFC